MAAHLMLFDVPSLANSVCRCFWRQAMMWLGSWRGTKRTDTLPTAVFGMTLKRVGPNLQARTSHKASD